MNLDTWVSPLSVQQPSSFSWRAQSGILQRLDGFGNWQNYTGNMNQFFNDYGIATINDVSGLGSVIGTFPFTYTRRVPGDSTGVTSTSVSSLASLIATIGYDSILSTVTYTGQPLLKADGSVSAATANTTITDVLSYGLIGLNTRLVSSFSTLDSIIMGPTGSILFNDQIGGSESISSLGAGLQRLNLNLLSWLASTGQVSILGTDGQSLTINDTDLELDTRYGFLGLANLLRGSNTSSGVPMTFIDYTTGQPESSQIFSSSLFDLNASGFEGIQNLLALYLFSHGTDLDIKERENMEDQANAFVDNFTDPSGSGTPSVGNVSDTAGVSSGIKDVFSSSATAADAFNQLTYDENYSFFSSEVQNSLNPFYSSHSYSRVDDDFIDYVHPKFDEILGGLGSSW